MHPMAPSSWTVEQLNVLESLELCSSSDILPYTPAGAEAVNRFIQMKEVVLTFVRDPSAGMLVFLICAC
jgi:hypothetical protein